MAIRNIKDAKDLTTGELIYFKGHAKATFMSDGATVEDTINFTKNKATVSKIKINGSEKTPDANGLVDLGTIEGSGGSSSGGRCAYAQVNYGTNPTSTLLIPNTFYVWNEVTSLTLSLGDEIAGVANEFVFQFTSGSIATSLTLPDDIKWVNGTPPTIVENTIYQISILNNLAIAVEWPVSAVNLITFSIDYTEYKAVEGTTWNEWIGSSYDTNSPVIMDGSDIISTSNNQRLLNNSFQYVSSIDVILPINYVTTNPYE